jgi:WD40 repeat protein
MAFSPDGKRFASFDYKDQTVKVWDAQSGQELFSLNGHGDEVVELAFSRDGKRLLSASGYANYGGDQPGMVKIWDTHTGQ